MKNKAQEVQIPVEINKNGTVKTIGRSFMTHPHIKYDGRKTQWFDDRKLLKEAKKDDV